METTGIMGRRFQSGSSAAMDFMGTATSVAVEFTSATVVEVAGIPGTRVTTNQNSKEGLEFLFGGLTSSPRDLVRFESGPCLVPFFLRAHGAEPVLRVHLDTPTLGRNPSQRTAAVAEPSRSSGMRTGNPNQFHAGGSAEIRPGAARASHKTCHQRNFCLALPLPAAVAE